MFILSETLSLGKTHFFHESVPNTKLRDCEEYLVETNVYLITFSEPWEGPRIRHRKKIGQPFVFEIRGNRHSKLSPSVCRDLKICKKIPQNACLLKHPFDELL